ncbi:MAG: flagellar hook-basal body complex protein FliE [Thermoleophilaceae bacterium]|jgi:flagellar hook-basal body complex protein FliE|nr:flagellar hook-basal body complex protein FliE [Thermoleophilaceae bacterium]
MAIPPIDPSLSVSGSEWSVGGVGGVGQDVQAPQAGGQGFGGMLSNAVSSLEKSQTDAAQASQSLVAGTATDPTQVVMSVERARLSMQLASQLRNKAVEAYTDIFHTQV